MHNIMLVDDDYPVLEYLMQAVPWESLGMKVQGCYESGAKALEAAKTSLPDILITDIGMPHMNGLELIRKMKELHPKLKVAILSCHNEFTYAQQAVRLQVDDYILKETIEIDEVVQLLLKLADQVEEQHSESWSLQQIKNESASVLRDRFLQSLLYSPLLFPERLSDQAKDYGIHLDKDAYVPVLCLIERYEDTWKRFVSEDNFNFVINNVIEELTEESRNASLFRHSKGRLLLFFPLQGAMNHWEKILKDIQRALYKHLLVSVTLLVGQDARDVTTLKERVLKLLKEAEEFRFYSKSRVIARFCKPDYSSEDLYVHYSRALNQFKQIAIEQAASQVDTVTRYWADFISRERYHPRIVREWFLKIMMDLQLKFKSLQHFRSDYTIEVLHQSILEAETLDQLLEMVVTILNSTFPVMDQISQQNQRKEITEAQLYVMRSLGRRVTQEEVADYLHLNPSYFSRLFKKETGETFVVYTTRMKMEKAKELIDQTTSTVEELAEKLGYENKSYFLKCFKNFTGLTPSEYAGRTK
ncbi:response regulator transcription factor [Paenibacillus chungangensis]|uniref:Response regulator n=1 Tax=Paenibacillus chungangensis TaxID=696535 RepID=A0ABW3HTM1_9BACL